MLKLSGLQSLLASLDQADSVKGPEGKVSPPLLGDHAPGEPLPLSNENLSSYQCNIPGQREVSDIWLRLHSSFPSVVLWTLSFLQDAHRERFLWSSQLWKPLPFELFIDSQCTLA